MSPQQSGTPSATTEPTCTSDCTSAGHTTDCPNGCGEQLYCGGSCCLDSFHDGECLCIGDDDGPGSCPA